ncbi:peroxisomal succinyl-coenzyme A thioesterase-like [Protopterus annectens]|uniref:peroxisomal succinyl-coenzyme A thioesterase-like n=1 Tax=Protopterus annectens TaxID=7888 RepID=UPI001CFAADAA|nr:peroxisomal succinyl-coenzyme A thioesterase-like [Protopterus annectens]
MSQLPSPSQGHLLFKTCFYVWNPFTSLLLLGEYISLLDSSCVMLKRFVLVNGMRLLQSSISRWWHLDLGRWWYFMPGMQGKVFLSKISFTSGLLHTMSTCRIAPRIIAEPTRMLMDEKFRLEVHYLPPHRPVTLHSSLLSERQVTWEAFAQYISGPDGVVKVDRDESFGGTYFGQEPMGLIWSMKPQDKTDGMRLMKKDVTTPYVVHISVYDGHISGKFSENAALATIQVERWTLAPGVKRVEVRENGIVGTLFIPPGQGPFPAVLDIWGGGGPLELRAALLACHGFVSLSLAYIFHSDLPGPMGSVSVGFDYFEKAFNFLKSHPQVSSDRIAIAGLSFGLTIVLLMAAELPNINRWIFFFFLILHRSVDKIRYADNGSVIWRDIVLPIPEDPEQKVKVGKIRCPVLLIYGDDDQCWPVTEAADDIEKMMQEAGNAHLLTRICYPGAGHIIEPPYNAFVPESILVFPKLQMKAKLLFGGKTEPHSAAQEDSWKRLLAFLEQHLILDGKPLKSQL